MDDSGVVAVSEAFMSDEGVGVCVEGGCVAVEGVCVEGVCVEGVGVGVDSVGVASVCVGVCVGSVVCSRLNDKEET